jgi:TonB family protein
VRRKRGENSIEFYGLLGSIVLHIVFLFILIRNKPEVPQLPEMMEVTIEPPSVLSPKKSGQEKQIVSQSEAPKVTPPVETERLSDQDQFAAEEKIRRGDGGGAPSQQPSNGQEPRPESKSSPAERQRPKEQKQLQKSTDKEVAKNKPSKNQSEEKSPRKTESPPQHLTNLRLDTSTLEEKFGVASENKRKETAANKVESASRPSAPPSISQYKAFSRPPGSGAAFLGSGGLSDYLPNLPDGDITLLNAKASQYAGFVRRVAVQVFAQLRTRGWENLSASEVRRIGDFTTVEAILSKDGKLQEVRLVESSGSVAFDTVLGDAAKAGAKDPNPPPGAVASDGRIHFIFKARSWSSTSANPRNGAFRESRWLLLATGLE